MKPFDFIAIDFETATFDRASICEVGIAVVKDGEVVATRSWLVQPPDNYYFYKNIRVHGITPQMTANAPTFDLVWREVEQYLGDENLFVAHNSPFDRSCLYAAARMYRIDLPHIEWRCTCQMARRLYRMRSYCLDAVCRGLAIPVGNHHRAGDDALMCAQIYLRELATISSMNAKK